MIYYYIMKKIIALLIIALAAIPAFAQDEDFDWKGSRRMAATLNPAPFIIGTAAGGFGVSPGFEYAFLPQFAAKAQLHFVAITPNSIFFDLEADSMATIFRSTVEGRWYPMENNLHGLFASGGLQFQRFSGPFTILDSNWHQDEEDKDKWIETITEREFTSDNSIGIYIGMGYKFIFGKRRHGLIIEPLLEYILSAHFGPSDSFNVFYFPLGTRGFRFTVNLGLAF